MARSEPHEPEKLTRYALGDLQGKERTDVDRHLRTCVPCREFLSFVQDFNAGLKKAQPQTPLPGEPCPDSVLLVGLAGGHLDEVTTQHVRAHILFCERCSEEYEALKQMQQPKVVEVVLRAAAALIEPLWPPDVLEWQSLLTTITTVRGEKVPAAPFRVAEMFIDRDRNKSKVALCLQEGFQPKHVSVVVESDAVLPEWKWRLCLLDGKQQQWANLPLDKSKVPVTSGIPYGFYALEVRKSEDCIGTFKFTVENFTPDEALEIAGEYLKNGDYIRALAILEDAHQRDPENEDVLEELTRARELAAEEGEEEESEDGEEEHG